MSRTKIRENSHSRRKFLKTMAGAAAYLSVAPYIGGIRRANAARGTATACIRFWLGGGARTSALWDAGRATKYAPYGRRTPTPTGVASDFFIADQIWPVGMEEFQKDFSVVRTIYHGDGVGTNHGACTTRMLTGGIEAKLPGWMTVINREIPSLGLPGIMIGRGGQGANLGSLSGAYSSLQISNANAVDEIKTQFSAGLPAPEEFKRIGFLRDFLSKDIIQKVASKGVRDLPFQQAQSKDLIEKISQGVTFDLANAVNAVYRPDFGLDANGGGNSYGSGALLAARLVEAGVHAVQIGQGGWDTHGGEAGRFGDGTSGQVYNLGIAIMGLIKTLKTLNLFNKTLIVVDTEFNRDNTGTNGFNGRGGSDHGSRYGKYISVMFAGGGVAGGRAVGTTTDNDLKPATEDGTYHSSRVNSTIYDLLGINHSTYLTGKPIEELYT